MYRQISKLLELFIELWGISKEHKRLTSAFLVVVTIAITILPEIPEIQEYFNSPQRVMQSELGLLFDQSRKNLGANRMLLMIYHNGDIWTPPAERGFSRKTAVVQVPYSRSNLKNVVVTSSDPAYRAHKEKKCTFYPILSENPRKNLLVSADSNIKSSATCPIVSRIDSRIVGYVGVNFRRELTYQDRDEVLKALENLIQGLYASRYFVTYFESGGFSPLHSQAFNKVFARSLVNSGKYQ